MTTQRKPRSPAREWTCSLPSCGQRFRRTPGKVRDPERVFCSQACAKRARSELALAADLRTQVAQRYRNGENTGDLAAEFGVSGGAIRAALREHGITPDRTRSGGASWAQRNGVPPDEGDLLTGYRWCKACGERKPMDEYYWLKNGSERKPTARARLCKPCRYAVHKPRADLRSARRKYNYGLTREQFEALFAEQGGQCAICDRPLAAEGRNLHVDHCHFDKQVRGLLCGRCNTGLGHFRDDPELLQAAANYIIRGAHWHPEALGVDDV